MRAAQIARLLPDVFQEAAQPGSVLSALLEVMEALHAPAERQLGALDAVFDPRRTQDAFVTMLASWLALDPVLDAGNAMPADRRSRLAVTPANLRELVAEAAHLARSRGTAASLCRFLELATGVAGFAAMEAPADAHGRPQPFAARIAVPDAARGLAPLIERIVSREKPAFTIVEIVYHGP